MDFLSGILSFLRFFSFFRYWATFETTNSPPLVKTNLGPIRGFAHDLGNGQTAAIFLGIPFAKPPIAELRFEKPVEIEPWEKVLNATEFSPACLPLQESQFLGGNFSKHSENCLFLNIYAPNYKSDDFPKGFPVKVIIHGGGYQAGSALEYGYLFFANTYAKAGIVVVMLQYRLAHFGFAATRDENFLGNFGLWDQQLALKVIHKNIQFFGGDPQRVTLFGHSAGAPSVGFQAASVHSQGFFAQTFQISGSYFAEWSCNDQGIIETEKLAHALNCDLADSKELKKCLKTKSVKEIYNAVNSIGVFLNGTNFLKFGPRLDGDFLTDNLETLIKNATKVPSIIGLTKHESLIFTLLGEFKSLHEFYISPDHFETFDETKFKKFVSKVIATESFYGEKAQEVQKKINDFYLKTTDLQPSYRFYLEKYTALLSDLLFNVPILMEARNKAASGYPVFLFLEEYFNYKTLPKDFPVTGSFHGSDCSYIFNYSFGKDYIKLIDEEENYRKNLLDIIINFVKTGNPSSQNFIWPQLDQKHPLQYAEISVDLKIKNNLFADQLMFWKNLSDDYDFDSVRGVHKRTLINEL